MKTVIDRIVQYANRYKLTNAETQEVLGTFDFDEVTGTVQQVGTEIDAELFQSIADDLAANVKAIEAVDQKADTHIADKQNPHGVTKTQVGLGNVDNTSDVNKPVSTAQATAIANAKKAGTDAQNTAEAHIARTDNPHSVTKEQVGLGNVNNTSDANKPVSTAQAEAIADAKQAGTYAQSIANSHIERVDNPHAVTKDQVGLGNVANERQYSAQNPPPYPVTSVNGQTGVVNITKVENATKATQDANGNVITTTYATKNELQNTLVDLGTLVVGQNTISQSLASAAINTACRFVRFSVDGLEMQLPKLMQTSTTATFVLAACDTTLYSHSVSITGTTALLQEVSIEPVSQTELSSEISERQSADTTLQNNINAKYTKPSTGIPESDLSSSVQASLAKADSAFQLPSDVVIGKSSPTITSATLYIKCQHVDTISASGNYYFINCSGVITVSGTSPKLYIVNSPNLTINGITSSNWRNVFIDGEASYIARNSSIRVNLNETATIATGIQDSPDEFYEVNMSIPDNSNRILRGYGNMAYSTPNYNNSKVEYVEFKISSNNLTFKPVYGESYFLISWVKFTRRLKI